MIMLLIVPILMVMVIQEPNTHMAVWLSQFVYLTDFVLGSESPVEGPSLGRYYSPFILTLMVWVIAWIMVGYTKLGF